MVGILLRASPVLFTPLQLVPLGRYMQSMLI